MAKKYLRCKVCGQIVEVVKNTGVPIVCCGEEMEELFPEVEDKILSDKHIPVYELKGNNVEVKIGSIAHPSTVDHYIEWIALETCKGTQRKELKPGDAAKATFLVNNDELPKAIYAYCNIHGLWKVSIKRTQKPCGCDLHME